MKLMHVLGIVVLTALLSISGTFLIMKKNYENEGTKRVETESDNVQTISKEDEKEKFVSTVDTSGMGWETPEFSKRVDEWKSGDEPFVGNLVEEVIQEMAHQKVIAKTKEGSIMITPERIDTLIQMVEGNKDKYERRAMSDKYAPYEIYLDILKRWKKGDFSTVDDDHNILMIIQGGKPPEGLATGKASEEQEIDYIFQVFGKEVKEVFGTTEKRN
ncbi:DUF6241 domain-containing protein [Lysinibacillus xylanilyticus]|uniref:Uncharacterized protein n=1 Tax=Lysinibacillus xylanilyticus TaxID=582475 RepID=A0A2M9Q6J0_9BACI|nr:DUF6241 domain-containing protein [Lysinibacillus xylanilyticus]PJO43700.1 hypothetical protein CWD94_10990 [Lysinibacillus xylanilyticus]